jgi:hypothetical protein
MNQKLFKKISLILIYLAPAGLAGYLVFRQLFPQVTFVYQKDDLAQSTLNLISSTSFAVSPGYDFKNIKITSQPATELEVKKGFAAAFYPEKPWSEQVPFNIKKYQGRAYYVTRAGKKLIPTPNILKSFVNHSDLEALPEMTSAEFEAKPLEREVAGFQDGTLIEYDEAVYVITDGRKMAFAGPDVFDALNYDWSKVQKATPAEARLHSNTPAPLTLNSNHPNGSILKPEGQADYYLIQQGNQVKLNPQNKEAFYPAIAPITVPDPNQLKTKTCVVTDQPGRVQPDPAFLEQVGNSYIFESTTDQTDQAEETPAFQTIKVTFTRQLSFQNIKNLINNYWQ